MIGLIQRVSQACVRVNQETIADINSGIVALVGIEKDDSPTNADRLLDRIIGYRIFPDTDGKMNLNLSDIKGDLLLIPQFTLAANTRKGMRPSFSIVAPSEQGERLFDYLLAQARASYDKVAAGKFGADMQLNLTNEGPVTFWLHS